MFFFWGKKFLITRFCPVNSRVPNLNLKVPKRQQCMGFTREKTTPTQLLLLYPFIMSGGPVMHSICNNDLVFHEALTFNKLKERSSCWAAGGQGKLSGYLYLFLPMWGCYCPLNMILLSHEWCFLGRKAWVNHTHSASWERDITLAIWGVTNFGGGLLMLWHSEAMNHLQNLFFSSRWGEGLHSPL